MGGRDSVVNHDTTMFRTIGYVHYSEPSKARDLESDVNANLSRAYSNSRHKPHVVADIREGRLKIKGPVDEAKRLIGLVAELCDKSRFFEGDPIVLQEQRGR